MRVNDPPDWDKPVFIVITIVAILLISKIVFWVALGTLIFSIGLYRKRKKAKGDLKGPILLIIFAMLVIPISYFIGYRVENIAVFNYTFNALTSLFS
jgi:heme/copper-type cytochrome/quinol oxidase subunit 2